ncbi:hypothetical protein SAMN06265784_10720 [Paraburkholderia susongensis]|uniref:Uncharacterized protein n=1 Tax=Paraburkholderia susongensis TaxID=1515439 RepID=A0A1X7LP29_9BURK|nr:hypothetical protein SAMN06265784_10720 [Paraburkholderia susongensis]
MYSRVTKVDSEQSIDPLQSSRSLVLALDAYFWIVHKLADALM